MHNKNKASAIKVEKIARTAHETIRGWRLANGQDGIPEWEDAPDWMIAATKESVVSVLRAPDMSPLEQHEQWMAEKLRDGWRLGPVKNPKEKTHPLLIPYQQLPEVERVKDMLMNAVVSALAQIED